MDVYIQPHDGALVVGPFATQADAETYYHQNMEYSGADVLLGTDPTDWPSSGLATASLVRRFERQDPPVP